LVLSHRPVQAEAPPVTFPHGVASGEVTPWSAVLWTRTDQEITLKLEVSTSPDFHGKPTFQTTLHTAAATDFTAQVIAAPLAPATTYYYGWRHGQRVSEVGTFYTAPPPGAPADVRFTYSGDSDGTRVGGRPVFNNFEALDAARRERSDFFVYLGD